MTDEQFVVMQRETKSFNRNDTTAGFEFLLAIWKYFGIKNPL